MSVIAPKAPRGPGVISVTRPATGALPGTTYKFLALMDAADVADASLKITLQLALDNRVVWGPNDWTCGVHDRAGNLIPPQFAYSCPESPPTNFTVTTSLPRLVNIGLDVTSDNPVAQ